MMISCIKPFQFVKHHETDYLLPKEDRYFVRTKYAGVVEITKETFEKLEQQGMEIR